MISFLGTDLVGVRNGSCRSLQTKDTFTFRENEDIVYAIPQNT
jgi:hypothetical protein